MGPIESVWKGIKPNHIEMENEKFRDAYNLYYVLKQYYDLKLL